MAQISFTGRTGRGQFITGISILVFLITAATGCVTGKGVTPENYLEIDALSSFTGILQEQPNGILANRNGEKMRTQIITFQFVEDNKVYFCTNGQKPLYAQLQRNPAVSFCTYAEEFEPVLSINGNVIFVDDKDLKLRALQGSANVKRFYQTVDNPDFKLFYIDIDEIETFGSEGVRLYKMK
jgi:uncharacterized pyridoxamine 5'-phosphate oxidase family protein